MESIVWSQSAFASGTAVHGSAGITSTHHQAEEFAIRAEVQPAIDVIRSATCVAARLVGLEGRIGEIAPGAYADILMVEGDPLDDIAVLARPDKHLTMVMKAGRVITDRTDHVA
ncbi:amidohydrolase family protein [Microtetraspora malaysiensis]|uniref:amidohydrolase family protein n=1 Tax=Microtetraspora malaysiensis TaxID=161358 RepID=UPI003D8ED830